MAEPFKQTPASRVFGFGLRPQQPAPTFFGTPILADRNRLSPYLRQNAFEEQQMAAQEEALAAQQQQMAMQQQIAMRNQQIMDAEMAAEQDLAAGEQLGNIFKKNPALAFSRNAGQFASAAQIMQPSNAMKAAIPSLAMKLPIEERTIFNQLLSDPEFSTNPFAAYDEAQRRSARARQHSELRKAGVPLSKIDTTRDYSPIEYEDLIQQHKQKSANPRLDYLKDFMDNVGKRVAAFEESDGAFDEKGNPTKALVDLRNKYAQISDLYDQEMMGLVMPKQAASDAVTAQKITAPAATGIIPTIVAAPPDPVKEYESIPQKTEQDFIRFAGRKDASPEFRQKVLQDLKEFVSKPVPKAQTGKSVGESINRDERLSDVMKTAEKSAARADEEDLYRRAWDSSKMQIDQALSIMAEQSGYTPEQLAETIKSGQRVRFKVDGKTITPKEWMESLLGGKFYDYASPFQQWSKTSLLKQASGNLAAETWKKVFDAYLKEKTKPVATEPQSDNVTAPEWKTGQKITAPGGGTITRTK